MRLAELGNRLFHRQKPVQAEAHTVRTPLPERNPLRTEELASFFDKSAAALLSLGMEKQGHWIEGKKNVMMRFGEHPIVKEQVSKAINYANTTNKLIANGRKLGRYLFMEEQQLPDDEARDGARITLQKLTKRKAMNFYGLLPSEFKNEWEMAERIYNNSKRTTLRKEFNKLRAETIAEITKAARAGFDKNELIRLVTVASERQKQEDRDYQNISPFLRRAANNEAAAA